MAKGPPSLVVRNKATRAILHLRGKHAKLQQASLINLMILLRRNTRLKLK